MCKILHLETATQRCSVALSEGENILALKESDEKNAHSQVITVWIDELLHAFNLQPSGIDAIAVSMGPGSYTGLRIGVSTAKGLCYALDKPLIAVNTLQSMAVGMIAEFFPNKSDFNEKTLFCPMIDARRMEVYSALFDGNHRQVREIKAEIISGESFNEEFETHEIVFGGDGAEKCKSFFAERNNAHFLDHFYPSAKFMAEIAVEKYEKNEFENVAYFEPYYLKDFIAALPKVKGLY